MFLAPWSRSRLEKKSGAGAAKKLAGSSALREDRSRVFLAPWSRSRLKKIPGAGAAWEKNQEPEPLEKSQEPEPLKNLPAPQP